MVGLRLLQRICRLIILELSCILPSRAYFLSVYIEVFFLFILLRSNLLSSRFYISMMGVLQFQSLSIGLLLKFTHASVKRFHFVFLLHKFRSRFSKEMISSSITKRFHNICRVGESDERFIAPRKTVDISRKKSSLSENVSGFNLFWLEIDATGFPVLIGS